MAGKRFGGSPLCKAVSIIMVVAHSVSALKLVAHSVSFISMVVAHYLGLCNISIIMVEAYSATLQALWW